MRCVVGGTTAVDGVSLRVAAGQCVAIIGESGAGKTTLLRCFNCMVVPSSGTVTVGGTDVGLQPRAELRRRIGYVPQNGGLLPHWNVLQNTALVPQLLERRDAIDSARQALTLVGLAPGVFGARFPHELRWIGRDLGAFRRHV